MDRLLWTFALLSLTSGAACVGGCMSLEPIVLRDDAADASLPLDVGALPLDATGEVSLTACEQCIFGLGDGGPSCKAQWDACAGLEVCVKTMACARAQSCLENKDFKQALDCGIPCAKAAGMTDQTSPEAIAMLEIVSCVQSTCAKACRAGEYASKP